MRKAAKARQCFELVNERTEDESLRAKALVYLEGAKKRRRQSSTVNKKRNNYGK
ncbi:Type III secretion chaperone protein for YopD(SycD) [Salmonella enterica subsp. enterica]|uniref:Type III secretion chaperone protein for YopD(SycD) n=1 Tax=Salmonella enterica I TaxID=59201 RepID=A0A447TWR2_SALET|nr:Type III secretion chaperone protein for YopD(SycD) [Salmonella enterica subsp. enterica]